MEVQKQNFYFITKYFIFQVWTALSDQNAEGRIKDLTFEIKNVKDTICPLDDGCDGTTSGPSITTPRPDQGG